MNDLVEFLTSQEIMVVYLIAGVLCLICFLNYIFKCNSKKYRMKNNTRELNKLVEEVKEQIPVASLEVVQDKPVIVNSIQDDKVGMQASSVIEMLDDTAQLQKVEPIKVDTEFKLERPVDKSIEELEDEIDSKPIMVSNSEEKTEELQYTNVEPSKDDAKKELAKIKEELKEQEESKVALENIALNNYEEEQEASAIISLDELVKKSKDMYEANEESQYNEENAPISLQDLEKSVGDKATTYDEPFIISNVVPEEMLKEEESANVNVVNEENTIVSTENKVNVNNTIISQDKKFKSSPIISPVYGIEKKEEDLSPTELELENTANYEKLDEEIKKTNEFLMTLRELQKKLD